MNREIFSFVIYISFLNCVMALYIFYYLFIAVCLADGGKCQQIPGESLSSDVEVLVYP